LRQKRIDVLVYINGVPELVGHEFRIVVDLVHQRRVRSPHNVTHPKPAAFSFGPIRLRQTLSLPSGVFPVSDGKTQASAFASSETSRQSSISAISPADSAAFLIDFELFGESISPR